MTTYADEAVKVIIDDETAASGTGETIVRSRAKSSSEKVNFVTTLSAGTANVVFQARHFEGTWIDLLTHAMTTTPHVYNVDNPGFYEFRVVWNTLAGGGTLRCTAGVLVD